MEQALSAYSWEDMESFQALSVTNSSQCGEIETTTKIVAVENTVTTIAPEHIKADSDQDSEVTSTRYRFLLTVS